MKLSALAAALLAGAFVAACQPETDDTLVAPTETVTPMDTPAALSGDIVAVAQSNGLTTLLQAAQAAGLAETLQGPGPFTVFAPTDAAFAALPAGTLENLLRPENREQLASILTYHVVPGETMSSQLSGVTNVATVNGAQVTIDASTPGVVRVGDATVVTADVDASNGVVHVIDKVIMPPQG
jgi:uncharacterized surface protein with fasciclin (FAS1) repeats